MNGVAPHVVVEVYIDIEAAFQPRANLRNLPIQVFLRIIPAISFAVAPTHIDKVGRHRFGNVRVSPVRKAERDAVFAKRVENRRNEPCCILRFNLALTEKTK